MRDSIRIAARAGPLLAIGFLEDFAFVYVFLIVLQTYLPESYGAPAAIAGFALAAFGAAKLVSQVAGGAVSDAIGARNALFGGTALQLAGNIAILMTVGVQPWLVLPASVLYGVASALSWPPIYSLMTAWFTEHERTRLSAALTLSSAAAVLTGLGIGTLAHRYAAFGEAMVLPIGAAAIAVGLAVMLRRREMAATETSQERPSLRGVGTVLRSTARLTFSLLVFAESSALGAVAAVYRAYGREVLDVSLLREVLLLAPAGVVGVLCVPIGGAGADRYGRKPFLVGGFAVGGLSVALLGYVHTPSLVVLLSTIGGAAFALGVPSVSASMMSLAGPPAVRGAIIGWFMTSDGVGQAVGPAVAGAVLTWRGAVGAIEFAALCFLLVAVAAARLPVTQDVSEPAAVPLPDQGP